MVVKTRSNRRSPRLVALEKQKKKMLSSSVSTLKKKPSSPSKQKRKLVKKTKKMTVNAKAAKAKASKAKASKAPKSPTKVLKTGLSGVASPPSKKSNAAMAVGSIDSGFVENVGGEDHKSLVRDARLVLVDSSKNSDKYYIIQLIHDTANDKWYCWQRWGRTGTSGQGKCDSGSQTEMEQVFENKFHQKSGYDYKTAPPNPKQLKNKYEILNTAKSEQALGIQSKWQYYVDDGVDGKADGWYDYFASASPYVEQTYHDFVVAKNANMGVRYVQSGYFSYRVDLTKDEYIQTNTSTNKIRKIRRVCL